MTGVIKMTAIKQLYNQSFGFIIDDAGDERFFHVSMFEGGDLRLVKPGTRVSFEPTVGGKDNKGLRATAVRVIA
jgi:cold shock CspA family protein